MSAIYINPVILFLTFAICFSSLLIGTRLEAALWREERVLKGVKNTCCCGIEGGVETVVNSSLCLRGGGVSSIYRALSIIRQRL